MTLADQIEELRQHMVAAAASESGMLRGLAAEQARRADEIEAALDRIIADDLEAKTRLVGKLRLLARRIGHLPAPVDITPERPPPLPGARDVPPLEMRFRPFIAEAAE